MNEKTSRRWLSVLCFIVAAALLTAGASFVLTPKWSAEYRSGTNIRGFYDMPEDSVDLLLLGSSHIVSGVNPNLLYENYGISAYCCGTEAQPMLGSYYWLLEAQRTQNIRAVVLDMMELFLDANEVNYRKSIDYMRLSPNKWAMLQDYRAINPDMNLLSYLLPLVQYHGRYTELTEEDFTGDHSDAHRGFLIQTKERGLPFDGLNLETAEGAAEIQSENLEYFRKLCEHCRDNDIALVLMITPDIEFTAEKHLAVQALADEYGLPFLDFNLAGDWDGIDYARGMLDFRHLNSYGAEMLTPYIAEAVTGLCELPDRRGDAVLDAMDARYQEAWAAALAEAESPTVAVTP